MATIITNYRIYTFVNANDIDDTIKLIIDADNDEEIKAIVNHDYDINDMHCECVEELEYCNTCMWKRY